MLVAGPLSGILGTRFGNKVPLAAGSLDRLARARCCSASRTAARARSSLFSALMFCRHRARVRRDAEPDHRGGAAGADRRGDGLQRARALGRRVARLAGDGDDPRRQHRGGRRAAVELRLHRRVRRLGGRRGRGGARRPRDPAREPAPACARIRARRDRRGVAARGPGARERSAAASQGNRPPR